MNCLLLNQQIEAAIAAGVYGMGVGTIRADKLTLVSKLEVYTHSTGSITHYLKIEGLQKNKIKNAVQMVDFCNLHRGQLMVNKILSN